jgi:hypothetical protein
VIKLPFALCAAAVLACGSLPAADLQDNVGIGLGTMIFNGEDGLVSQVSAATTNASFGNQTFAISSGTSNAKRPASFTSTDRVNTFTKDNLDALARDMAAGSGETLATLDELLGVKADQRDAFNRTLQAHFAEIYTSATVTHTEVLKNISKVTGA